MAKSESQTFSDTGPDAKDPKPDADTYTDTANCDAPDVLLGMDRKSSHGEGEKMDEELKEDENEGVPTDTGWSWVIVAVGFINAFFTLGHRRCIQALFVDITEEFQESTTVVSLTFTCWNIVSSVSTVFTTNVLLKFFHARTICVAAACMNGLLTMFTFWAPSIIVWLVIYALKGISFGPCLVLPMSMIGPYFKKRRGLASSIMSTGVVAANIALPPLSVYIRQQYGFRWTMLILGALELSSMAPMMLLRPPSSYRNVYRRKRAAMLRELQTKSDTISHVKDASNGANNQPLLSPLDKKDSDLSAYASNRNDNVRRDTSANEGRTRTTSGGSISLYDASLYGSTIDEVAIASPVLTAIGNGQRSTGQDEKLQQKKKECCLSFLFDPSITKLWLCRMMMVFMPLGAMSLFTIGYLPVMAFQVGISKSDAALLLTMAGCTDLAVRIITGYIADKGIVTKEKMVIGALLIIAIIAQFGRYITTYALFCAFAIVVGVCAGFRQSLYNAMCLDYFGAAKTPKVLSLCIMATTLGMSFNHPVVGSMVDLTGSFQVPLHYIGAMIFLAVVTLSCHPIFKRWDEENKKKEEMKSTDEEHCLSLIVEKQSEKV